MFGTSLRFVESTPQLVRSLAERLEAIGVSERVALVCDTNTYTAAGERLEARLPPESFCVNFGLQVKPTIARAEALCEAVRDASAVIVVGSGTLTDLSKYACHKMGKRLISVPSAASMNGYASATASLMGADGYKASHACKAPDHIWLDSTIYTRAPLALSQAGLGDTLCRSSVQMDALLSHLLTGTWYDQAYFEALQELEVQLIRDVAKLQQGDGSYIDTLMQALILSGDAMRRAGSSAPASQAEHMIAHLLEQKAPLQMQKFFHGAHIAVTSLTMTRLQSFMVLKPLEVDLMHYAQQMEAVAGAAGARKLTQLRQMDLRDIARAWQQLQSSADGILLAPEMLEATLMQAGLPTDPEGLGVLRQEYIESVRLAFTSRDRMTFLDIAAMRNH